MDLHKLDFINQEESSSASPKRHRATKSKSKSINHHSMSKRSHLSSSSSISTNKSKPSYKNVRLESSTAFKLQAMQEVTGDRSRSDLISRMLDIVGPVILNSSTKKRKYRHDLYLLRKRDEIVNELNHKL